MNVAKTLTWVSRALFGAGVLLFLSLFVFAAIGSESTITDAGDPRARLFVWVFSSVAWCWLAGSAARTLATAASWPRALTEVASLLGFGIFFAFPVVMFSGVSSDSGPSGPAGAAVCAIAGFVVIIGAKVVAFVTFGAKDAVHSVEQVVGQVKDSIAEARDHGSSNPPSPGSQV